MITIAEPTPERTADLVDLFGSDEVADRCWCMWFIVPVKAYHEAGHEGNQAALVGLMDTDPHPVGLIAYDENRPVGWCAVGPRDRFTRMLKAPTLRHRDKTEDATTWLVPCFFIRGDARGRGVASALLEGAVDLARRRGANAIEGFPLAGDRRRSGPDLQVGVEPLFAACGFEPVHRPSDNRVIMRRELG
jgi:GNAT superfamily N-acetyltransferase